MQSPGSRLFSFSPKLVDLFPSSSGHSDWQTGDDASLAAVAIDDAVAERRLRGGAGTISATLIAGLLILCDGVTVAASGGGALLAYADPAYILAMWPLYAGLCLTGAVIMLQVGRVMGLYAPDVASTPFLKPWQAAASWAGTMLALLGFVFFFRRGGDVSRAWVGLWFGLCLLGLATTRLAMRRLLIRWRSFGLLCNRVVVVADTAATAAGLVARLSQPLLRDTYRVMGVLSFEETRPAATPNGPAVIAPDDLLGFLRDHWVQTVVICTGRQPGLLTQTIGQTLADVPVEVLVMLDEDAFVLPVIRTRRLGDLSLLQVGQPPLDDGARLLKSLVDRSLGAIFLFMLTPLLLLVTLAIKLDSRGPVMFRQQRFGYNNRPFWVLKFRSMYADQGDATGARRTVRRDARVTRVGRILRASSLDELPQLINVLRGEMSLVGPRAHPVMMKVSDQFYHEAVDRYAARHRVKPGITGLAQINGYRGEVDTLEKARARLNYDLDYVARWSLWLDFKIMMLTPIKAFRSY